MRTLTRRKQWLFSLVLAALVWAVVEGFSFAALGILRARRDIVYQPVGRWNPIGARQADQLARLGDGDSYLTYDRRLGWTIRPNARTQLYRANADGLRADREHPPDPPPGVLRIAAFGDSFTHASDVPNGATWEDFLEQRLPGSEVLNFGVPAYGVDQAFLRYQQLGVRFRPHVVLVGFMGENIKRGVSTFRPFYLAGSGVPLAKPRFELHGDALVPIENPIQSLDGYRDLLERPQELLPRIGAHDFFLQQRPRARACDFLPSVRLAALLPQIVGGDGIFTSQGVYDRASEPYRVARATLLAFARAARADGALPIVVLFPERSVIRDHREGRPASYAPLREDLEAAGLEVVDLLEAFDREDPDGRLVAQGFVHYPVEGNQIVARHLAALLEARGLTTPDGVRAALRAAPTQLSPR